MCPILKKLPNTLQPYEEGVQVVEDVKECYRKQMTRGFSIICEYMLIYNLESKLQGKIIVSDQMVNASLIGC
jgi:hypothetical protein